jgi:hypothetical protein
MALLMNFKHFENKHQSLNLPKNWRWDNLFYFIPWDSIVLIVKQVDTTIRNALRPIPLLDIDAKILNKLLTIHINVNVGFIPRMQGWFNI